MSRFLDNLLAFGRVLRRAGIDVHPGRMIDVVEALGHVNLAARDEVYFACRALLVHDPHQIPAFDRAFDACWRGREADSVVRNRRERAQGMETTVENSIGTPNAAGSEDPADDREATVDIAVKTWSDRGGIAGKDFAECTADEQSRIADALAALTWTPGERRTRRW